MIDCDDLRAWSYDDMVSDRNGCYIQDRYIVIGQEIVPHMDILSVITIEPGSFLRFRKVPGWLSRMPDNLSDRFH